MARSENDREDLFHEARALVERAELRIAAQPDSITVGFRRDGSLSVFFGPEPVYQFNAAGQLRRAFVDGLLVKAEQGRLVALRRQRTESEVVLLRTELDASQHAGILAAMCVQLARLRAALDAADFKVVGQVGAVGDVIPRVHQWLAALPAEVPIASRPHVGG